MQEARKPRPKLSRRRPPPGDGCSSDGRPWFLRAEPGACERPWASLVRTASAELGADGEVPPLPGRVPPEPARAPAPGPAAAPEAFAVAGETFTWTPFPPAPRPTPGAPRPPLEDAAPRLRSCPLCQADFPPLLTQLDIDSHLAQCLAESTEDVVW